jgi:hypothetical protein
MRKALTILAMLTALQGGMARADDDCLVPMAEWAPRAAVEQLAADSGWEVRRIRIDDGCYEITGRDATGRAIEVKVHPGTLDVVEFEFEEEEVDEDHDDESHGDD